jgi:hypothetical protein
MLHSTFQRFFYNIQHFHYLFQHLIKQNIWSTKIQHFNNEFPPSSSLGHADARGAKPPRAELTDSHGKHAQGSRRKAGDVRGERAGEVVWAGGGAG